MKTIARENLTKPQENVASHLAGSGLCRTGPNVVFSSFSITRSESDSCLLVINLGIFSLLLILNPKLGMGSDIVACQLHDFEQVTQPF